MKQIIGLSGTNGAGKDAVGVLLAERHNFLFISVSDVLRAELHRRGVPTERENMRALSIEWRQQHGLGILVEEALTQFDRQQDQYEGVVIASLRNPAEVDALHSAGGVLVWVDADPHVRYTRIAQNHRPGRTDDINKTYEQFLAEEAAEMHAKTGSAAELSMADVQTRADVVLLNNTGDLEDLAKEVAILVKPQAA